MKHSQQTVRRAGFAGAAASLMLLVAGCQTAEDYSLTCRLWDNGDLRKYSEPAPNPNLALFEATNHAGVLIEYDALSEKHSTINRRAYYLQPNQARIDAGKKPKLVKLPVADGMKPIPVLLAEAAVTNPPPELTTYAVTTKNGRGFTLYRPMESGETFDLPVYAETSGTPARIALTPFALAGDTAMVAAVAAAVGFVMWLESGAPTCF